MPALRELSIFIDESGDFGPAQEHSPFYILGIVLHDQSDDITTNLDKIHGALRARGLPENHAIHTGPLIRREADYRWLPLPSRRSLFRVLFDFVRVCEVAIIRGSSRSGSWSTPTNSSAGCRASSAR